MGTLGMIEDPSEWIKNVKQFGAADFEHKLALSLFDDEGGEHGFMIQSYRFNPSVPYFSSDHSILFAELAYKMFVSMSDNVANARNAIFLCVHENLSIAKEILDSVLEVPETFGLQPAAAFSTDYNIWQDVMLGRQGVVDLNKITQMELYSIVYGNTGRRFNPDGTEILPN